MTLVFSVLNVAALTLSMPIADMFGQFVCPIYFFATSGYFHSLFMGGFMMALFRFMIVIFPSFCHSTIGLKNLVNACIFFQILRYIAVFSMSDDMEAGGYTPSQEFCYGFSPMMSEMMWIHLGGTLETKQEFSLTLILNLLLSALFVFGEIFIYLVLIRNLYLHNKESSQRGILTKDAANARNEKNVVTLTGIISKLLQ